jgi:hypothetical protein
MKILPIFLFIMVSYIITKTLRKHKINKKGSEEDTIQEDNKPKDLNCPVAVIQLTLTKFKFDIIVNSEHSLVFSKDGVYFYFDAPVNEGNINHYRGFKFDDEDQRVSFLPYSNILSMNIYSIQADNGQVFKMSFFVMEGVNLFI